MTDDRDPSRIESDLRRMLAERARQVDPALTGPDVRRAAQDRGTSSFASGSRLRLIGGPAAAALVAAAAVITPFLLIDRGGSGPAPQPGAPRHSAPAASTSRPAAPITPPVSARPVPQTSPSVGVPSLMPTTAVPSSVMTPTALPTPTSATEPPRSTGATPVVPSHSASPAATATSSTVTATG